MNKVIKIKKGQFIKHIMDTFPTNYIIHKTLTGIGSTSLLLEHNSQDCIIVVPNLPVIKCKCKKYNKGRREIIKGVYEGVSQSAIENYLNNAHTPKRFITTPESYFKIKQAIEDNQRYNLYKDFYLLMDECERLVQDVNYRDQIILPFNDFFSFKRRAMISATPMKMTDPRFELNNIKRLTIKPNFDYKEDIKVICSNNIELSLRKFISENERDKYFIFHNSVDSMGCLIKRLEIEDESAIFCGVDSAKKMRGNDFKNVNTDIKPFKKFNFLSSRFFSALDIEGVFNPTIITLTDLYFAEFTAIDPLSQSIQIQGRFRGEKDKPVIKEIVHITNIKDMHVKSEEDILDEIRTAQIIHRYLKGYAYGATTNSAVITIRELLKTIQNRLAITEDSDIMHFLKDNMIFENKIKEYYTSFDNLLQVYEKSNHFNVTSEIEEYSVDDQTRIKLLNVEGIRPKTLLEILVCELAKLKELKLENPLQAAIEEIALLQSYKKEAAMLNEITLIRAEELNYDIRKIRAEIKEKRMEKELTNFEFIGFLEQEFLHDHRINQLFTGNYIKSKLKRGIQRFRLFTLRPTIKLFRVYFRTNDVRETINGNRVRGHKVLGRNNLNSTQP